MFPRKKIVKKTKSIKNKQWFFSEEYRYLSFVRFIYVIETNVSLFFQNLFSVSIISYDLALNISAGDWKDHQTFLISQGYPYFNSFYYKTIDKNPKYHLTYFNIGIAYTQMRGLDETGKSFRKTIDLDSAFEQNYRNLAIIDYIKGDYKSSLFNFEKFLSLMNDENAKKMCVRI